MKLWKGWTPFPDSGLVPALPCWMELAGSLAVWLPRKVCAVFRLCPLADYYFFYVVWKRSGHVASPSDIAELFYGSSVVPTGSTRRCDGGRWKATDDRRIVYVSFWISYSDLQAAHPSKVISDNEWTPAAAAANKCRLDGTDAPRKRMPFQLSRQEMHRKFFAPSSQAKEDANAANGHGELAQMWSLCVCLRPGLL